MAKILILIGAHLCTAPRPQKEAETLANAGHDVTVRGFWFIPEFVKRDRLIMANKKWKFEPIIDLQPDNWFPNLGIRLQARLAKELFKRFNLFSPPLLGYGARAMLKVARQTKADLTIVQSEAGLWAGNKLLDEDYVVGVDFEDWFSEDLPISARTIRPIVQLKALESRLARNCNYSITTSGVLASALANAYNAQKPTVIYNAFPWIEREQIDGKKCDRKNLKIPSLHWFSQTIGSGRGLETLFLALPHLKNPVEIHLRGNCSESTRKWLESLVPDGWNQYLFIHPTVPNRELLSRISEHDTGLALEQTDIPSRNLTVTNKLFQYLQAGLAVIATDTSGQQEIFSKQPDIGRLIPNNNPLALAQALEDLLQTPEKLNFAKLAALQAVKEQFCWEQQEKTLIQTVEFSLNRNKKS